MPGYFYFFLLRMRVVNPLIEPDPTWRLAMVVTKAPSEPWPLVRRTLEAMLAQDIPHDTWLADEAPSADARGGLPVEPSPFQGEWAYPLKTRRFWTKDLEMGH